MAKKLPVLPSNLLRVAQEDMNKAVVAGLTIYMSSWVSRGTNTGNCSACLAGAVMLNTLKGKIPEASRDYSPYEIIGSSKNSNNQSQISALNFFRSGHYHAFLYELQSISKKLDKYSTDDTDRLAAELINKQAENGLHKTKFYGTLSEEDIVELNKVLLHAIKFFKERGL